MINLPVNVDKARLPAAYEHAKASLAKCEKIDECKTWADKAAALASYAMQAKDDTLAKHCRRIQSRAMRRAGQLLASIEKLNGRQVELTKLRTGIAPISPRKKAARAAGMGQRQQFTALNIASIPEKDFEASVESNTPLSVHALAKRAIKKRAAPPAPSQAEIARGWFNRAVIAALDARSEPIESCPNTQKMRDAVTEVIAAWSMILENLNTRSGD